MKFKVGQILVNPITGNKILLLKIEGLVHYRLFDSDKEWVCPVNIFENWMDADGSFLFVDVNKIWKDLNS